MQRFTTRIAPLLVGTLAFAATALPATADHEDDDNAWGREAVEWCRDGHADDFTTFGQCVSSRVHELKGHDAVVEEQEDDSGHGRGPKRQVGQQRGQGHGHGHGNDKNKNH